MSTRWLFTWIGLLAALAGTALWWAARPSDDAMAAPDLAPGALLAARFTDSQGKAHTLAELQGKVVVLNFWATWCAPCREEMPAFERLQTAWGARGVQFVGLSAEEAERVEHYARSTGITYPLWVGDTVPEISRRLGNRQGVLPFTVLLDRAGQPVSLKVGTYLHPELDELLKRITQ